MSDLTIQTYRWCLTNEHYRVNVAGSHGKVHSVTFDNRFGWHCDCLGFQFRGYCRHVGVAEKQKCSHGWEAAAGSPVDDWVGPDQLCPDCGGPSTPVNVAV